EEQFLGLLILELDQAAFGAAVTQRLPFGGRHLLQRLGFPEGSGCHGATLERVLENVLPFLVLLECGFGEWAERHDLEPALPDIHHHVLDQRFADAHAAEFFRHTGMVDDQDALAGLGESHFSFGLALDLGDIAAAGRRILACNYRHNRRGIGHGTSCFWGPVIPPLMADDKPGFPTRQSWFRDRRCVTASFFRSPPWSQARSCSPQSSPSPTGRQWGR